MDQLLIRKYLIIFTIFIIFCSSFFTFGVNKPNPQIEGKPDDPYILNINHPIDDTRSPTKPMSEPSFSRTLNDWRMHLYGPNHNAFTTASGPTNSSILWYNTTGDSTYSSPCVAEGRVFLGVGDSMKCYYENNGTLNWTMYPDNSVSGTFGICSSPAYANGCIYFGADQIYCVWATNGTIRWKVWHENHNHGDGSPTLAYGKVFIAGSDHVLYCIDQITGVVDWTFQAKDDYPPAIPDNWGLYAAPAVVNGSVYLAACDWYLYQINITQPTSVATANHTFKMDWASYSSPVVVGDKVYVGCSYMEKRSEGRFYCLWASNLTKIWDFYPNKPTGFFSSAGYYNGQLFIGSIDGALYCLNASSGKQIWSYTLGSSAQHSGTWSSPAITKERFYIGTKSGYIYCFNTTQPGSPDYYWRYYISGEVDTSPSVVPGRVYIGTHGNGGGIYCFGTPDNHPPQVISNYPVNSAVDVPSTVEINVTFNEPINPTTLTTLSFIVKDSGSNSVNGIISYDSVTKTATFNPNSGLKRGKDYSVTITTDVQDYWTNALDGNLNNISDGSPSDDFTWNFTTSSNNPPTLTNPSMTPSVGNTSTEFEFKVIYTDIDNDSPEVNPGFIRVIIDDELIGHTMSLNTSAPLDLKDGKYDNGEEYIYSTTFSNYGQHNYKFICFDGIDEIDTLVYNGPTILAEPIIDSIGELDAYEDINLILTLADKIHDEDTKLAELIININSSYANVDDLNITFNYPNEFNYPSGRDYEIVNINVSDSVHNVFQDIRVNVHAVNDPPLVEGVPDIQVKEDEYYYLDITPFLTDVDNELDQLTVTENSSYATVTERNITFYYPKEVGILSEYIEINVTDGELFGSQDILVTIIPEGIQFVFLPIPKQNAIEDIELTINMTDYIMLTGDLGFDDIELESSSSYCSISGLDLLFIYPNSFNYPSGRSFEIVQVNVTTTSQTESQSFTVNVQATNDGPVLTVLKAPIVAFSDAPISFQVSYRDIDGSEEPVVSIFIGGSEYMMNMSSGDIYVKGAVFELELQLPPGEYEYYYYADDGESEINSVFKTKSYNLNVNEHSEIGLDSDGDTMPDAWEVQFKLDPNNPSDAIEDPDGDGYTNLDEYLGFDKIPGGNDFTNPRNPDEFPEQDHADKVNGNDDSDNNFVIFVIVIIIAIVLIVILLALFSFTSHRKKNLGTNMNDGHFLNKGARSFEDEENYEE
jgi:outer membrane protein assembly factor BamB